MKSDMDTDIPHPKALVQNFFQAADIISKLGRNKITLLDPGRGLDEPKRLW
jgi:hypothetical protein